MLKVKIPNIFQNEQKYILNILLEEFLKLDYVIETYHRDVIEIKRMDSLDKVSRLTLNASFFSKVNQDWLKIESMKNLCLKKWSPLNDGITANLVESSIPILFGFPGIIKNKNHIHLNIDIFGSAFFMLSRYEELISNKRDNHNRFPGKESVSFKSDFLNRPIVDEYTEILWSCLQMIWPDLERKKHKPKLSLSCDVDQPFDCSVETLSKMLKACAGDLIKRKNFFEIFKRVNRYLYNKIGNYKFDRKYTFNFYMDVCANMGLKTTFYFIPSSIEPKNGCYKITDKKIINLIRKIDARGHEIGIHGSYQTFQDKEKMIKQKILFEEMLQKLGIQQKIKGNRQHYLRWDSAVTPDYLNEAGFEYDASGSYADRPGFRYGTSKEFSMWGWQSKNKLKLKQRPLIVMEVGIARYMNLGYSENALKVMQDLKKKCQIVNGTFSILWHNSELYNKDQIYMFKKILKN